MHDLVQKVKSSSSRGAGGGVEEEDYSMYEFSRSKHAAVLAQPLIRPHCRRAPRPNAGCERTSVLQEGGGLGLLSEGLTRSTSALLPSFFLTTTASKEVLCRQTAGRAEPVGGQAELLPAEAREPDTKRSVRRALQVGAQGASQTFLVSTTAGTTRGRAVKSSHADLEQALSVPSQIYPSDNERKAFLFFLLRHCLTAESLPASVM